MEFLNTSGETIVYNDNNVFGNHAVTRQLLITWQFLLLLPSKFKLNFLPEISVEIENQSIISIRIINIYSESITNYLHILWGWKLESKILSGWSNLKVLKSSKKSYWWWYFRIFILLLFCCKLIKKKNQSVKCQWTISKCYIG